jgi:pimeloyl-ACP methyl ester carboxylesterase
MPSRVVFPKTKLYTFAASPSVARKQRRVVFIGGNQFPVRCFTPLFTHLNAAGFTVDALELLPLSIAAASHVEEAVGLGLKHPSSTKMKNTPEAFFGSKTHFHGFNGLGDDLLRYLTQERPEAQRSEPVAVVGWSMGATAAVMAAAQRPDLFAGGITLLDPANIPPSIRPLHRMSPVALRSRLEPVKSALRKRDRWPSRSAFEAEWVRKTKLLRRVTDEAQLRLLAEHMVVEEEEQEQKHADEEQQKGTGSGSGGGGSVTLAFPKQWEAHFFLLPDNLWPSLKTIVTKQHQQQQHQHQQKGSLHRGVPIQAICAKPSLFCSERDHRRMRQWLVDVHRFDDYSHLIPLEAPELCAKLIAPFVR